MSAIEFGILGLYFLTLVILAIMGFHRYVMVWLYFKHKDRKAEPAPLPDDDPVVDVVDLPAHGDILHHQFIEMVELPGHPWYLGCQFHPEFKSKPMEPHPLFKSFIGAACEYRTKRLTSETAPLFAQGSAA